MERVMLASDVLTVVERPRDASVHVRLDGGWGIDALLEEHTRVHADLECVIARSDAPAAQATLGAIGFVLTEIEPPTRFVVRGPADRRGDVHSVTFDDDGSAVQELQDGSPWRYPSAGFLATGSVGG